jgi:tetratricopeptide (TPR) repeat protein
MSKVKSQKHTAAAAAKTSEKPGNKIAPKYWLWGILAFTFLLYASSLQNGFVMFDDDRGILYNETIKDLSPEGIRTIFRSYSLGMYAPVAGLVYAVVYQLGGLAPFAYHLAAVLFHLLNVALIFFLFQRLTQKRETALPVALLFGIHPFQVEPVSWAAAMSTPLFTSFYLGSVLTYLKFQDQRKWALYGVSLALCVLAILTKSAAVTLPALLILLDYFQERQFLSSKMLLEKVPYFLLAISFGWLTFVSRDAELHGVAVVNEKFSLFDRFFMVSHTLIFYVVKMIFPLQLSLNYPFDKTGGTWPLTYYLAPLSVLAIAFFVFKAKKYRRELIFGFLFFLIPLSVMLPFITVGTFELRSDRYNYLSCAGIFFLAALAWQHFSANKQWKTLANALLIAFVAGFSIATFARTKVWKSGETLFADLAAKAPDQPLAQFNQGMLHLNAGRNAEALGFFNKALQLDPNHKRSYEKRGQTYLNLGQFEKAVADLEYALRFDASNVLVFHRLGQAYSGLGNTAKAIEAYNKAIELEPNSSDWYYVRGLEYHNTGQTELALADYDRVLQINPQHAETLTNRGNIHAMQQRFRQALEDYSKALSINPKLSNTWCNRGGVFLQMNEPQKALEDFNQSISLDPNYAKAYIGRAATYNALNQPDKAQQDLQKAQSLRQR